MNFRTVLQIAAVVAGEALGTGCSESSKKWENQAVEKEANIATALEEESPKYDLKALDKNSQDTPPTIEQLEEDIKTRIKDVQKILKGERPNYPYGKVTFSNVAPGAPRVGSISVSVQINTDSTKIVTIAHEYRGDKQFTISVEISGNEIIGDKISKVSVSHKNFIEESVADTVSVAKTVSVEKTVLSLAELQDKTSNNTIIRGKFRITIRNTIQAALEGYLYYLEKDMTDKPLEKGKKNK